MGNGELQEIQINNERKKIRKYIIGTRYRYVGRCQKIRPKIGYMEINSSPDKTLEEV